MDNQECIDLIKSWFQRCTQSHGPACALEKDVPLPTRLVYVPSNEQELLRLCNTKNMRGRFACLSYCWGHVLSPFNTSAETLENRMAGFKANELPDTLLDAVSIVRRLGLHWIWVDSLCILQGDPEDWSRESSKMATVYGNAAFTISADLSDNANAGIIHPRTLLQSHQFGRHEELCLQELPQEWESITRHPLYRRGWAFQERMLSPRVLHVFRDQVAWECNKTLYREGHRGCEPRPDYHFAKNMFTKYFHHQRLLPPLDSPETTKPDEIELGARIGAWNSMAQEISVRLFTYMSDRLPAVSGLASALEISGLGYYIAGVWQHNPFLSMAWHVRYPQEPPGAYRSPSWSWVWTGNQLMWHYATWHTNFTETEIEAWKAWNQNFGPRLDHDKIILKDIDPKGEVKEGSYIIMTGFCRDLYVAEITNSEHDPWEFVDDGAPSAWGAKVYMDRRRNNWDSFPMFDDDFSQWDDSGEATVSKYLCVQIARERKPPGYNPKTLALILEEVKDGEKKAFKRAGLFAFDFEEKDVWTKKTLKLF